MLREKAAQWNDDKEIQAIVKQINFGSENSKPTHYSTDGAEKLLSQQFDLQKLLERRLPYERLDQLTIDLLLGVR
jgi:xylose isomerase